MSNFRNSLNILVSYFGILFPIIVADISKNIAPWKKTETSKETFPVETVASLAFCSQAIKKLAGSNRSIFCLAIKETTIAAQPKPCEKFRWHNP